MHAHVARLRAACGRLAWLGLSVGLAGLGGCSTATIERAPAMIEGIVRGKDVVAPGKARPDEVRVIRPDGGEMRPLPRQLRAQDEVRTGSTSAVMLEFADGTRVQVQPNTHVIISSVLLRLGQILVEARGRFRAQTDYHEFATKGTRYRITAAANCVAVDVAEGAVEMNSRTSSWMPVAVAVGNRASAQGQGAPSRSRLDPREVKEINDAFQTFSDLFDIIMLMRPTF